MDGICSSISIKRPEINPMFMRFLLSFCPNTPVYCYPVSFSPNLVLFAVCLFHLKSADDMIPPHNSNSVGHS